MKKTLKSQNLLNVVEVVVSKWYLLLFYKSSSRNKHNRSSSFSSEYSRSSYSRSPSYDSRSHSRRNSHSYSRSRSNSHDYSDYSYSSRSPSRSSYHRRRLIVCFYINDKMICFDNKSHFPHLNNHINPVS